MQFCKKSILNYKANPILKFKTGLRYGKVGHIKYGHIDMPLLEQIGWLGNAYFVLFVTLLIFGSKGPHNVPIGRTVPWQWADILERLGWYTDKYGSKQNANIHKKIEEFCKEMKEYRKIYGK